MNSVQVTGGADLKQIFRNLFVRHPALRNRLSPKGSVGVDHLRSLFKMISQ